MYVYTHTQTYADLRARPSASGEMMISFFTRMKPRTLCLLVSYTGSLYMTYF